MLLHTRGSAICTLPRKVNDTYYNSLYTVILRENLPGQVLRFNINKLVIILGLFVTGVNVYFPGKVYYIKYYVTYRYVYCVRVQ